MISLGGITSLCILAMVIGKRRPGPMTWIDHTIIAAIALIQAAVVLFDMFTMEHPLI